MDYRARLISEEEREYNTADATNLALSYARERNFMLSIDTAGNFLKTVSCELTDATGRTATGRGKGVDQQSSASALFEAFEHYYHKIEDKKLARSCAHLDIADPANDIRLGSPDLHSIFRRTELPLTCLRFRSLQEDGRSIDYPAILTDPAFQPDSAEEQQLIENSKLYRYSTNSGTAAGVTPDEAVLHGLLELIERDALGLTLIRCVISPAPEAVRELSIHTLPKRLQLLLDDICRETCGEVKLWDITSDLGVPCALCAISVEGKLGYRFFGSGASLCAEYAFERAMLEALQGFHIQNEFGVTLQVRRTRDIDRMTHFQRCGLDAGYFEYRGGVELVDFSSLQEYPQIIESSVSRQVEFVLATLSSAAIGAYVRTLHSDGIFVTQVVAPQLERFYLVMHGLPILPGARGRLARRTSNT